MLGLAAAALLTGSAAAAAQDAAPSYSLVAGRVTRFQHRAEMYCYDLGGGSVCPRYATVWLDHAGALAGPAVAAEMNASTERGFVGYYRPVLVVLIHPPGDVVLVVAQSEADEGGLACIAGTELERLGWHPAGSGIVARGGDICADLTALAAFPVPPPVQVVSGREARRWSRRMRRNRR